MIYVYNGTLHDSSAINLVPDGWLSGTGIFETIKTVNGIPWALSRHMRRAIDSAARVGITLPDEKTLRVSISELLEAQAYESGALRICFDDKGNWAAVHQHYEEKKAAAKLTVVSNHEIGHGIAMKTFPYTARLDILQNANAAGFDEAIVLNSHGRVCEGAVTNLLFKINDHWCTPPLSDGVLPGVMRALVIEHLQVQVRAIDKSEISSIESGFLLSSLRIAQPISSIDSRKLSPSQLFGDEIRAMAVRTSVG
jgi:branched-chain amino acid aminotransferase